MSTNKPFIKKIIWLGIVPTIMSILVVVVGFFWIQNDQLVRNQKQIGKLIENTFYAQTQYLEDDQLLTQLAPLLYIDPISSLAIIDGDKKIVEQRGLPIDRTKLTQIPLDEDDKTSLSSKEDWTLALPYTIQGKQRWLISTAKCSGLRESLYKGIILAVIVASIAIAVVAIFSQKLHRSITTPVKVITAHLRQAITSKTDDKLIFQDDTPFADLAESVNDLVLLQYSAQDEMQNYVEQSTKELRETLETVEIQNIELDIARKNALQASRAKSEFLANTSHELRTPLNGILGFTSLLLKTGLTNQQKDYLSTIEQSAQGLLTVINDILDFSKLETGQLTLEYKPIYVREIIEEVFSVFAPQAHEKNIHLLSEVNHNVPRNLLGDTQRLKQVLTNLISNSIKFSPRGNVIVRCTALGEMDSQIEVKFTISDNGIGLTEEQQESLFTAFTKVDSSDSRLQGGTGLGLAIAKGLVDRMRGEIGVDSEARSGSTFWFTVRLGVDKLRISQSPLMNSLYGVKAFAYDSNPAGLSEITHLLSSWGVNFIEEDKFEKINTSIQLRSDEKIDILILDAYTSENNFDKARLLQQLESLNNNYKTPIILLAPPAIQRNLQDDIIGLNTIIVQRPLIHNHLHQSICNVLSIAEPLATLDSTPNHTKIKRSQNLRVLVVDDNASNRKLVCEFLKPLGAITVNAESGYEALEKIETAQFDLILMDVQMPGMDGMETTQMIRSREKDSRTPIVALTAHAVSEQKTKLLLSGMDDFLSKPVSEEDLVNIIERWVKYYDNKPTPKNVATTVDSNTTESNNTNKPTNDHSTDDSSQFEVFSWSESMRLAKDKPSLATDMLVMLTETLDETSDSLRTHLDNNDMDSLFEVNHKFHGGCCYCGVPALRYASKALETCLQQKQFDQVKGLTENVIKEIASLKKWSAQHDLQALFSD